MISWACWSRSFKQQRGGRFQQHTFMPNSYSPTFHWTEEEQKLNGKLNAKKIDSLTVAVWYCDNLGIGIFLLASSWFKFNFGCLLEIFCSSFLFNSPSNWRCQLDGKLKVMLASNCSTFSRLLWSCVSITQSKFSFHKSGRKIEWKVWMSELGLSLTPQNLFSSQLMFNSILISDYFTL